MYTLRELRQDVLWYSFNAAVQYSGIPAERLAELERGADPTVFEAYSLSRTYGVDPDQLGNLPIQLAKGDILETLAQQDGFKDLDDEARFRLIRVVNAARVLKQLRTLAHEEPSAPSQRIVDPAEVQKALGLPANTPIVAAITALYACLTPDGPACDDFPLPDVPPERRAAVAQTAARLYAAGKITRRSLAEALDVSPVENVEVVLDRPG